MELKLLNNTQKDQVMSLLSFYKFIYVCNRCGLVYGNDTTEKKKVYCPKCLIEINKEKKENKQ